MTLAWHRRLKPWLLTLLYSENQVNTSINNNKCWLMIKNSREKIAAIYITSGYHIQYGYTYVGWIKYISTVCTDVLIRSRGSCIWIKMQYQVFGNAIRRRASAPQVDRRDFYTWCLFALWMDERRTRNLAWSHWDRCAFSHNVNCTELSSLLLWNDQTITILDKGLYYCILLGQLIR